MHDLEREVADQPDLLRRLCARHQGTLRDWRRRVSPRRLVLTGCGDMAFAARTAAAYGAVLPGSSVVAWPSMDLRWYAARLEAGDALVLASISGRTPRTLEALRLARSRRCATLVLTDDPDTPLGQEADEVICLETARPEQIRGHDYAGYASEVPQTRTFLAVLLLELLLADAREDPEWVRAVPDALSPASPLQRRRARELALRLAAGPTLERVHVLGSGPFGPVAAYGAAKLLEYAIHATPQCLEEFHHLEMFTVGPGTRVVALAYDAASRQRWQEVEGVAAELGGDAVAWYGDEEEGVAREAALPTTLFLASQALQWQAFELALALGRDPDRWVGGVRREQIFGLSQRAVRGSQVWRPGHLHAPSPGAGDAG